MERLIVLIVLTIVFSLAKGGAKKNKKARPNDWMQRTLSDATRMLNIKDGISIDGILHSGAPQGEGEVQSEGFAFGEGESAFHQPMVNKAPQNVAGKRRPAATARPEPVWAEGAGGAGSMTGFNSSEGECAPNHAHTGPQIQMALSGLGTQMDLNRMETELRVHMPRAGDHAYGKSKGQQAPSLQFSTNPAVNGLIWSEILRRPGARRR